jgi:hypothetical protein
VPEVGDGYGGEFGEFQSPKKQIEKLGTFLQLY